MSTPEKLSQLLADLINIDRTTTSIDNGVLTIVQNGQTISLPLSGNTTIRSSISRF